MVIIQHLIDLFNDEKVQGYIHDLRWRGKELECPRCGSKDVRPWGRYHRKPGLKRYRCRGCRRTFNDLTGTVFHDSHLSLGAWLLIAFLMALGISISRISKEIGARFKNVYKIGWYLRNLALFYEISRRLEGEVEVDEIYQRSGLKGQKRGGGKKELGREARRRGKRRSRGRGQYEKDTPLIIAWISRRGKVVLQVWRNFTAQTVKVAAMKAVKLTSKIYSDCAKSYRVLSILGYTHEYVNHSKGEYARGEVHENRAEGLFSLLKPYLLVFRGLSKELLPAYVGFFQFLRNFNDLNCFGKAEKILEAGLDPRIASEAKKGLYAWIFISPVLEDG